MVINEVSNNEISLGSHSFSGFYLLARKVTKVYPVLINGAAVDVLLTNIYAFDVTNLPSY